MTLLEGLKNEKYEVVDSDLEIKIMRHLEAMGLTGGTHITILNKKRSGAIIFMVRGTRLAVGKDIAKKINIL